LNDLPLSKLVTIYRCAGWLYVRASSRTTAGVWIGSGPVAKINEAGADTSLGAALAEALDHSRLGVPHPSREAFAEIGKPLLETAGVKTWSAFERKAKCAQVVADPQGRLCVTTMMPNPGRGYLQGPSVEVGTDPTSHAVLDAVRSALGS
jgi:hypothetical protein